MHNRIIGLGMLVLTLGACQTTMLGDDRIASSTAGVLGVKPDEVSISDRWTMSATDTAYTATTKDGKVYACTINGGGLLAMGLTNAPSCKEKAT